MSFRSNILSQKHLTGVSSIQPRFVKCLSNQIQPTLRVRTRRNEVRNSAASVDASVPAESAAQDIKGDVVKASPFNNPLVRGLSLGLVLLALGRGTGFLSTSWLAFCNVSAYGIWVGSMYMQTFIAGLTMFKNMPRIMFGKVQTKIFPKYFTGIVACNVIVIGTMLFGYYLPISSQPMIVLFTALFANLVNWVSIEPKATDVLMQRYELEATPEGRKEKDKIQYLYKEFSKLHGLSSLLNLVSFLAVVTHGWWLAKNLAVSVPLL
eukprot:TRINITY_DN17989_c0_g1_i4.p1 TRINITY_DN17989_c0_g1~~TRINITY_DN17989_c0_g1_i4.p1  ORF type:complete len:265 (-),score=25.09 TRINITY_DN17989_c0_g1_i4:266-1060(-)